MTRQQLLRAAAQAQYEWDQRYADEAPAEQGTGGDYSEHHADISAASAVSNLLNRRLVLLLRQANANGWLRRQ